MMQLSPKLGISGPSDTRNALTSPDEPFQAKAPSLKSANQATGLAVNSMNLVNTETVNSYQ